jgi:Ion channel
MPRSFSNLAADSGPQLGQLVYFSLGALTTAAFGDILPLNPIVCSLANLEAVIGQLFLVIVLSRLVALQVAQKAWPAPEK